MRCVGVNEVLNDYIDGSLPAQERLAVEDHLTHCSSCTDDLELLTRTIALLGRVPEVEVPKGFRTALHQRLKQLPAPVRKPAWKRYASISLGLPAAAAAMLIGMIAYSAVPQSVQLVQGNDPSVVSPSGDSGPPPQGHTTPDPGTPSDNQGQRDQTSGDPQKPDKGTAPQGNGSGPGSGAAGPDKSGAVTQPVVPSTQPGGPKDNQPVSIPAHPTVDSITSSAQQMIPTVEVGKRVQFTPHFRYSAQFDAAVDDPAAAQKKLEDFAGASGGKVTIQDQSGGVVRLFLQVPAGKWAETIALLKGLNGGAAIPGETAFPLTDKYEQIINDKARLVTLIKSAEVELLKHTSDDPVRSAQQDILTGLKSSLKAVDERLKGYELQNSIGTVQVTLTGSNPGSGKIDSAQATAKVTS